MARYARQEIIQGWDQSRLAGATLAIAGSGHTAFFAALMATAMGFGRLLLFGEGVTRILPDCGAKGPLEGWAEFFRRVNPRAKIYGFPVRLSRKRLRRLPALDGLIIAGNDMGDRHLGWNVGGETGLPTVAGGAAGEVGIWGTAQLVAVAAQMHGRPESPLLSQIVAGLLVDEIRKALLLLPAEEGRVGQSRLLALPHLGADAGRPVCLERGRIALVGAGALGTWLGMALGISGVRAEVEIYDDDEIDETNLNRQVLFFDAVGRPKAPMLARRLQTFFPQMRVSGYGMRADAASSRQIARSPLLMACPDNFAARAFLNDLARRYQRVLINGGTSAVGGSCTTYAPGRTICLACRMNIDRLAQQEQQAHGCSRAEASVVTSNAIVGALMAWTLKEALAGKVKDGVWEYDGRLRGQRLGVHSQRPACQCHSD